MADDDTGSTDTTSEPWEPKTREDWVNVFADSFALDRKRQADEAAAKAAEGGGNDGDKPARRPGRNFLGGRSS